MVFSGSLTANLLLAATLRLCLGLLLAACSQTNPMPPSNFLSLGDSYTIGESVPESDRWSVILANRLRQRDITIQDPNIIAQTGWTTAELQEAIRRSGNTKTYDLVSLLIGVNNQYRGQSRETYRTEFRELLTTAVRYAGNRPGRVFVLSIPDWGVTPFAASRNRAQIAAEIDAFNAVAREECQKLNIAWVDITPVSRTAAGNTELVASDGLHFSGKMHEKWVEAALPVVTSLLAK